MRIARVKNNNSFLVLNSDEGLNEDPDIVF